MTFHRRLPRNGRNLRRKGNSVIEFALVSVFIVPLMMGTVNVGMSLGRSIQVTQVSRDAGHMFVRQVDFSQTGNKQIIVRLSAGLGMTANGGNGVVILSRVMYVGEPECVAAGFTVATCPNYDMPVFTQRIVIGNVSKRASDFGTPAANILNGDGSISPANYLTNPTARLNNFNGLLQLQAGELAYVSEAFFDAPEWSFPQTAFENTGVYSRTIF
jgi:Flp pilus assembly protein TadG